MQDGQLWIMDANGYNARQASNIEGGISNVKFSPKGDAVLFTREVKTGKTTADLYPSLPKANARIIDDLMYRHWSQWEDDQSFPRFLRAFQRAGDLRLRDRHPGRRTLRQPPESFRWGRTARMEPGRAENSLYLQEKTGTQAAPFDRFRHLYLRHRH